MSCPTIRRYGNFAHSCFSSSLQKQRQWFDWVEVDWDDNNGNVYTVPATLDLLYGGGQILYSDQSTDLLASAGLIKIGTFL